MRKLGTPVSLPTVPERDGNTVAIKTAEARESPAIADCHSRIPESCAVLLLAFDFVRMLGRRRKRVGPCGHPFGVRKTRSPLKGAPRKSSEWCRQARGPSCPGSERGALREGRGRQGGQARMDSQGRERVTGSTIAVCKWALSLSLSPWVPQGRRRD